MKNVGFIFIFIFFAELSFGQLQDDFSDGNLSAPDWFGSTAQFHVNAALQLQLNGTTAGTSFLSTSFAASSIDNFEWQVYVKQSFSPSGNNYGRVYLASTASDFTQPLDGYYLQFGEAGSNDAVQLFQQTGLVSTSVCRAGNGGIAAAFALRVKVLRDGAGGWEIWIDYSGGTQFNLEATGTDKTSHSSSFFGFLCVYTSSNASKFYYDDVYAGPQKTDGAPPSLLSIQVQSSNTLELKFSELLNVASAENVSHFSADNNLGNPQSATFRPDSNLIELVFRQDFSNGLSYELSVSDVSDLSGNVMTPAKLSFYFFLAAPLHPKDVIITEIFPDPVPQIGLPNAEFIELYNRSANAIDLSQWKISDGSSTGVFSSQIMQSHSYWIVTAAPNAALFTSFGNVISPSVFPLLNNDTDTLTLKCPDGRTIDSLNYALAWYRDPAKEVGGWTMELIDPNNPCGEEENWTSSEDPQGGTPGRQNSVLAEKPDLTGPMLLSVIPIHENALLLTFNEKLEASAVENGSFVMTPPDPVSNSFFKDRSLRQIELVLESPLSFGQLYSLKATAIRDCNGNEIQESSSEIQFALPEAADSLDVLVNEILFNPRPNGTDFVEVVNHSSKFINLKNWKLANIENHVLENVQLLIGNDFMLSPRGFLAITADPEALRNNYPQGVAENFFTAPLPGLPDNAGSIALVTDLGKVIDCFSYDKDFHSPLVQDDEGVSLERISYTAPTQDPQNWKSASSQSGFATPGYLNSNARPENPVIRGNISIEPEIFIPGSGSQDFAKINYRFEQPGYVANVKIFNQEGQLIKVVANNETLGFEGFLRWDGDRDNGNKARIGYYIVWVEIFDLSGDVNTFRKRVIISTR